jgi:ABC-type dipeptide/oligopeptide/nickel transport system ATPase component
VRDANAPLTGGIRGCAYALRCPYAIERCREETPEIRAVAPDTWRGAIGPRSST